MTPERARALWKRVKVAQAPLTLYDRKSYMTSDWLPEDPPDFSSFDAAPPPIVAPDTGYVSFVLRETTTMALFYLQEHRSYDVVLGGTDIIVDQVVVRS